MTLTCFEVNEITWANKPFLCQKFLGGTGKANFELKLAVTYWTHHARA